MELAWLIAPSDFVELYRLGNNKPFFLATKTKEEREELFRKYGYREKGRE
jgi:hypothetical protein